MMSALPATSDTHAQLVAMDFKARCSSARAGATGRADQPRRKLKARHQVAATIAGVHEDRDGRIWLVAGLETGATARSGQDPGARQWLGRPVTVVYSRTDADGSLREPRLLQPLGQRGFAPIDDDRSRKCAPTGAQRPQDRRIACLSHARIASPRWGTSPRYRYAARGPETADAYTAVSRLCARGPATTG